MEKNRRPASPTDSPAAINMQTEERRHDVKFAAFSLGCLLAAVRPAAAFESDWRWVRVEPRDNAAPVRWDIEQGVAKNVTIIGGKFSADLYPDDLAIHPGSPPVIRLRGALSKGRVTASASYVGTDAGRETWRGVLHIQAPEGDPMETDRITLKGDWADGFIGLTRVKSPSPR